MKSLKTLTLLLLSCVALLSFTSCERVEPNYLGVKMENYGKAGKSDYHVETGRVFTMAPGTELFQLPAWEQRGVFTEVNNEGYEVERILHLKAADNTEFTSRPIYSFEVIPDRAVDVVFRNSQLGSGNGFIQALEDNVLETRIYDLMKEESRHYTTDYLMANGGSLKFEDTVQLIVAKAFEEIGLRLKTFSCQLDFSDKVKAKIDSRNEVNTNISVLDQQIAEQRKRNELADLKAQENRILSQGLTQPVLIDKFIDKWDGKTPLYGNTPITLLTK